MKQARSTSWILAVGAIAVFLINSGCNGGAAAPPPPPPAITVAIAPSGAQFVDQGQSINFTANVSNDSSNKGVDWSLTQNGASCSPTCGTISPTSTASGQPAAYTAPAAVNANLQFNVTATSVADTTKSNSDTTTAVPPPALNNPATLPAATVGHAYSYQLTESGGVPPITWNVTSGSLPAGLNLSNSGLISGTPTTASQVIPPGPRAAVVQPNVTPSGVTVQGCDSGTPKLCSSQAVSMVVNSAPDFTLSASSNGLTIAQGGNGISTITVNPIGGFNASVALSASGLPSGVTAVFNPTSTATASTLTLTASATAATGTVTVTITGNSGNLTHTTTISLTVALAQQLPACSTLPAGTAGEPSISSQPANQNVAAGQMATFSVTASNATSYQWYRNGSIVNGATGASYQTPATASTDNGAQYTVLVSNSVCSVLSNPASLAVTPSSASDLTFSTPAPPPPTPTQNTVTQGITLTQAGGAVFAVTSSLNPSATIDWQLNCGLAVTCGSVVPSSTASGAAVTFLAPTGLPLAGESFTLIATRRDQPNDFASAFITVKPCSTLLHDPMCGEYTFLIQGFDAKGNPDAAAGHFTATGLANGNTMITDGVMDMNDSDGIDAGVPITSGSYTFDKDSTGALLPNVNGLIATVTLNIATTMTPPPPSHTQRTYAFTSTDNLAAATNASLIEFEQTPSGGTAPRAAGFQGSGTIWGSLVPGPYAFPAANCAANSATTPPSKCNYALQLQGGAPSGPLAVTGTFNISVNSTNNCILSSAASAAGATDLIEFNQGVFRQGILSGTCGALTNVNGISVADDVNGRGTAVMSIVGTPNETFAYYVIGGNELVFVLVDPKAPSGVLSGFARATGITSATPMNTLGCGTILFTAGIGNCVVYTAGGSQQNGTSGSTGADVTLSLARFTCPTPNDGGASCKEPLPPIPNNTLTGNLSVTLDQVTGGLCNGQMVSNTQACGNPATTPGSYSIDTTTGVGSICLHAAPCATFEPPPISGNATAFYYADGFLLANDKTAASGSLREQMFYCVTPCVTPSAFPSSNPGPYVGATVSSSQSIVPNVTASFTLSAPAAPGNCAGTSPSSNFDSDAMFASGTTPGPFALSIPPAPAITGCFNFDNSNPLLTGRGTGTSTSPGPADFVFYEVSPVYLLVMQTDDIIPGGQALLTLTSQNAFLEITSDSSTMACANGSTAAACANGTIKSLNSFAITATGVPTPALSQTPVGNSPNLGTIGLMFTDNKNGTAAITGTVNKDTGNRANCDSATNPTVCTYVFTIAAQNVQGGVTVTVKQTFVLDVIQ